MTFKISPLAVPGLLVLGLLSRRPQGLFWRPSRPRSSRRAPDQFCQDNHSLSCRGVVRGSYQLTVRPSWSLSQRGDLRVAVDVRRGSETLAGGPPGPLGGEQEDVLHPRGLRPRFYCPERDRGGSLQGDREYCQEAERGVCWSDQTWDLWPVEEP